MLQVLTEILVNISNYLTILLVFIKNPSKKCFFDIYLHQNQILVKIYQ
jgi:hypothetical protein